MLSGAEGINEQRFPKSCKLFLNSWVLVETATALEVIRDHRTRGSNPEANLNL